ncbi:hypothetical protein IE077_002170 [Cardiosporidium cionae]|uniref:Uncharacterized protein n=1 Tax=Cardiosporidium cionae TaxID=476202 RepID=A0ABQ7JBD0_9APIC|nr:hypothetical protein IE077_002170 [Cardiosporidium cionae]|eukprot:KAF8821308.1 hypothetical protein IE077_002170 [Cardiosporidium cionae]
MDGLSFLSVGEETTFSPQFVSSNPLTLATPHETLRTLLNDASNGCFPFFDEQGDSTFDDDAEEEKSEPSDCDMECAAAIPTDVLEKFDEAKQLSLSIEENDIGIDCPAAWHLAAGFTANLLSTLSQMTASAGELKLRRQDIRNSYNAKKNETDSPHADTQAPKSFIAAPSCNKSGNAVASGTTDKWYNLPKEFQGTEIGKRFHEIQSRSLSLLLLQLRRENRYFCECTEDMNYWVEQQKQTLQNTRKELLNAQYELAWFYRRIEEEDSFKTPVWDALQKVMISQDTYLRHGQNELHFVRKEDDLHQFTLNWLNFDLKERIMGKESLDAIKREREVAEQRLQALTLRAAEIPKKFQALDRAVKDIYDACTTGSVQCVEFPEEARVLPGPLLNLFSRLFGYRHLMSDDKCDVGVQSTASSANISFSTSTKDTSMNSFYELYSERVILTLSQEEETPIPMGAVGQILFPFPLKISFDYLPALEVVTVKAIVKKYLLIPNENTALLANLLENDTDDFGFYSPNPSNFHNELPEGIFDSQKCQGGRPFRWAQTLAGMKYGISLPSVKSIPEEVNVQDLLKRIRRRITHRMWCVYQMEHLKSKPNAPLSIRKGSVMPDFPQSFAASILSCSPSTLEDYRRMAPLQSWPEDFEGDDMMYMKAIVRLGTVEISAYFAIPLIESLARFRIIQTSESESPFTAEADLSASELHIYNTQRNETSGKAIPMRASNTIVCDDTLTHYQHAGLQELEDFVNTKAVTMYGGMEGNYHFCMLMVQIVSLKIGLEKYVKGRDSADLEGNQSTPTSAVESPKENDTLLSFQENATEPVDVEMTNLT